MFAKIRVPLVVSVFLFLTVPASAATFSDNFDNADYTSANWDVLLNTWNRVFLNGSNWGYHGINDVSGNQAAASFADNQQYFFQPNLTVNSLLRLDGYEADQENTSTGFVFISGSTSQNDYREYTVLLEIDYDDDPSDPDRELNVWSNSITPSGTTETLVGTTAVSITFDTFYSLQLSTDSQGNIDVELYEASSSSYLGGLSGVSLATAYNSGMVGLVATDEATFDNFSLTGNPVPIPGAIWLLGSGLVGLAGFRKKFKK